jgi:uncharacterized membrane protein
MLVVSAGTALRYWRLDAPPGWLDESVTALIAAGRGPDTLPAGRVLPLAQIAAAFTPDVTARSPDVLDVYNDPRVQDLHPPTYHLLANLALRVGLHPSSPLIPRVRALAALFGVLAIAAMYGAARQAFGPATAIVASLLVAVSPYAVMLSREARNYTAVLMLMTVSLAATLAIARRAEERRGAAGWWALWIIASAAGLYVHYFALFAFVAHAFVLAATAWRLRARAPAAALGVAVAIVAAACAPWAGMLIAQQASPEQRWLLFSLYGSSPLDVPYRILSAWQTMLFGKAWDLSAAAYQATRVLWLAGFIGTGAAVVLALLRAGTATEETRAVRLVTTIFVVTVLEYVAAMALQGKDFVSEVRYHVACYPAFALLVAWACARRLPRAVPALIVAAGVASSVMVDLDVESWKGIDMRYATTRLAPAASPELIVAGVGSFNETVAHATLWTELARRVPACADRSVAFVRRTNAYASVDIHAAPALFWGGVAALRPDVAPASVRIHSAGMAPGEYRATFELTTRAGQSVTCRGLDLDTAADEGDTLLTRPAYRRYACTDTAVAAR